MTIQPRDLRLHTLQLIHFVRLAGVLHLGLCVFVLGFEALHERVNLSLEPWLHHTDKIRSANTLAKPGREYFTEVHAYMFAWEAHPSTSATILGEPATDTKLEHLALVVRQRGPLCLDSHRAVVAGQHTTGLGL